MGSSSSLRRDDPLGGTLNRLPALRMTTRDLRPGPRREAVLLGTTGFYGDTVYDLAGKFLGEIEEIVLDTRTGCVRHAVVALGGFLGIGRKRFAIPWSALTPDVDYRRCVVNAAPMELKAMLIPDDDPWLQRADST